MGSEGIAVNESENGQFVWNPKREKAAIALANGYSQQKAAVAAGVVRSTIQLWIANEEFAAEVDRLAHMVGIAARAERLKQAKRLYRLALRNVNAATARATLGDLLSILKYVQSETDGAKLDLTALLDAFNDPEE